MRAIKSNTNSGFTIVELLIVIVIIAILAAITIVAYNGIQNRAKTGSGQALANALDKKVESWNTLNNAYPTYCQLVTNSLAPTGSPPAAGTPGVGTCVAGGTSAGAEVKLDNVNLITPASAAAGTGYTTTVSNGNAVAAYYFCSAAGGSDIFYIDYTNSSAITTVKSGTGC